MMMSTTNDQPQDLEAPPVGGIVLGNAEPNKNENGGRLSTSSRVCDTTIMVTTLIYSVLIVILFVAPRALTSNDLDGLILGLMIVFLVGGGALIAAGVNLVLTIRRWGQLSTVSKFTGILPTFASIVVTIVVSILVAMSDDNGTSSSNSEPDYKCLDYITDCKNQTAGGI